MTNSTDLKERSCFRKYTVLDIAKQICLIDMEMFRELNIEELNSFNWTKKSTSFKSPSIIKFIRHFNKIYFWALKEIIEISQLDIKIFIKFIKLAKCLSEHRDYFSAYAIVGALSSCSIERTTLWAQLDSKYNKEWHALFNLYSLEKNMANLWDEMETRKVPCVPYIGLYQSHLIRIDTLYPRKDPTVLKERTTALNKIFDYISYFQKHPYNFSINQRIRDYILSQDFIDGVEQIIIENFLAVSKELEEANQTTDADNSSTNSSSLNPVKMISDLPSTPSSLSSISFGKSDKYLITRHRKSKSNEDEESGIYRKISDVDQQWVSNIVQCGNQGGRYNTVSSRPSNTRKQLNLVDDSEIVQAPVINRENEVITQQKKRFLHSKSHLGITTDSNSNLTSSMKRLSSYKSHHESQTSLYNFSSLSSSPSPMFVSPLAIQPAHEICNSSQMVMSGVLMCCRKIRSSICTAGWMRCFIELTQCATGLDCFLAVYCNNKSTPSSVGNNAESKSNSLPRNLSNGPTRRSDGSLLVRVSLIQEKSHLKLDSSKSHPRIILNIPHETYQFKLPKEYQNDIDRSSYYSDKSNAQVISIEQWWEKIQETINKVESNVSCCLQEDLINLDAEFTRL